MAEAAGIKVIKGDDIDSFSLDRAFLFIKDYPISPDSGLTVFPGFCDVHVHFREPGFFYKESIKTGSLAAAHGGYTDVCAMPNLNPVPDSAENLSKELDIIASDAVIGVYPYAAITKGEKGKELSDMEALAPECIAFSDDGKGVQDADMMLEAMKTAKRLGKIIAAHCEDESLLFGGVIHKGKYAKEHGLPGICSESEWKPIERDLKLASQSGCAYHVCHISCKESVQLIREAKAAGIDVSCETAPHYLIFEEDDLCDDGRFKMNPPLRSKEDRQALLEGIADGTIDMIATDHAPHAEDEKSKGLLDSSFGIVGLETAFSSLYTFLVKKNIITLDRLAELLSTAPRRRFGIKSNGDCSIWDINAEYTVDTESFFSKGRSTPFEGKKLFGKNLVTVRGGKAVYCLNSD